MLPTEVKLAVDIDRDLHNRVMKHFEYGQLSHLLRKVMTEIDMAIQAGDLTQILIWMYDKTQHDLIFNSKKKED